jgi:hypothetical protein
MRNKLYSLYYCAKLVYNGTSFARTFSMTSLAPFSIGGPSKFGIMISWHRKLANDSKLRSPVKMDSFMKRRLGSRRSASYSTTFGSTIGTCHEFVGDHG